METGINTTALETMAKSGYSSGADMLLMLGEKEHGHSTSHSVTINAETKERVVKPTTTEVATVTKQYWKDKSVTGLSVSISAEGLVFYGETGAGYKAALLAMKNGTPIEVKCFERGNASKPYIRGKFVITSLEMSASAGDDTTYSISLENAGAVTIDETGSEA